MRLEITTNIGCVARCNACPQDKLIARYQGQKMMSYELFKFAIDNTPSEVRIDFSGFSEPFLNSRCTDMILYASKTHKVALYTTLIGANNDDYERLKGISFEPFVIHIADREDNCKINVAEDFVKKWSCDAYSVHGTPKMPADRPLITYLHDRAGNGSTGDAVYKPNTTYCTNKGYVLLPNGDIYLCCMDFSLSYCVGSIYDKHIWDYEQGVTELCKHCINSA